MRVWGSPIPPLSFFLFDSTYGKARQEGQEGPQGRAGRTRMDWEAWEAREGVGRAVARGRRL